MKIKTVSKSYDEVMALPRTKHQKPIRPWPILRALIRVLSIPDLLSSRFSCSVKGELPKEPCLILMNHSSFIDLKIAYGIFFPKSVCIVGTSDSMVGKQWLMRRIGCIPTQKFVTDLTLIRDIKYALKKRKSHVLMFPEAGYTFDGCATTLPENLGGLLKLLDVPVIMVKTEGAFLREPLYNELKKRKKVTVSATVETLLTREQIAASDVDRLNEMIQNAFTFDGFASQQSRGVVIDEPFRADGLERILYKCAACGVEGRMEGKGTELVCHACQKRYELDVHGSLVAKQGKTEFPHIPDWYRWERECVRSELENGEYSLDTDVTIGMMVNCDAVYMVGEGHLRHDTNGFLLTGCEGKLRYEQKPQASYSVNSDYFWYEIGDMISIGNRDALYYCFPKQEGVVAKTRLAAEELYKLKTRSLRGKAPRG